MQLEGGCHRYGGDALRVSTMIQMANAIDTSIVKNRPRAQAGLGGGELDHDITPPGRVTMPSSFRLRRCVLVDAFRIVLG